VLRSVLSRFRPDLPSTQQGKFMLLTLWLFAPPSWFKNSSSVQVYERGGGCLWYTCTELKFVLPGKTNLNVKMVQTNPGSLRTPRSTTMVKYVKNSGQQRRKKGNSLIYHTRFVSDFSIGSTWMPWMPKEKSNIFVLYEFGICTA
jgi:hypothetical protein